MEPDATLLHRYATARDANAFAELVHRYAGMVFAAARRVTGSAADAEDVAQTCFVELARRAGAIRGSAAAWLHATAVHRACDARRNKSLRVRHERAAAEKRPEEIGIDDDARDLAASILPLVDQALAELSDELRLPLIEHFLRGRPQTELASELGVSQPTISRRIESGIEQLRANLRLKGASIGAAALTPAIFAGDATATLPASLSASLGKLAMAGVGSAQSAAARAAAWGGGWLGRTAIALILVAMVATVIVLFHPAGAINAGGTPVSSPRIAMTQPSANIGLSAIDQISVSVTDLDVAEKFYSGVLGLKLVDSAPPNMKFFDCAGVNLLVTQDKQVHPGSIIYFKVDGVPGLLQKKFAALRAAGVSVDGQPSLIARNWHGKDVWLAFFHDPFGNQLALKSDVPVSGQPNAPSITFQEIIPELPVKDGLASIEFYTKQLGFKLQFGDGKGFTILSRGEVRLALLPNDPKYPGPASCYLFVDGIDPLYAEFKEKHVPVGKIGTWPYGMRDFEVTDPDGNRVSFGQDASTLPMPGPTKP